MRRDHHRGRSMGRAALDGGGSASGRREAKKRNGGHCLASSRVASARSNGLIVSMAAVRISFIALPIIVGSRVNVNCAI
jgi:hypothetical protein